ncbi:ribonuclease H-like domain-containing protein [Butyriboletus roseoflavus]|nr:ribonuclease H-like domain-containing protein [Butyriboletus roseoflavus]
MHNASRLFPKYSWRDRSTNPALFYFTNHHEANAHLASLPHGHIGFDLEWRPNYRKGQPENRVALVQLATADTVILLHIHHMTRTPLSHSPSEFPFQLAELLSSPYWIKAGVSIQYDCAKLYRDFGLSVRNCVELSLLARTVDNARWKGKYTNQLGLARLVETYEQATLLKGRVQRSDWELPLNIFQLEYAANDAHAGYIICSRLLNMAKAMDPVPLPSYYSFSLIGGHLRDTTGMFPWQAHNPDYDPGPPPPPKPKRLDKPDLAPVNPSELQQGT